jgi:hypothetical protein
VTGLRLINVDAGVGRELKPAFGEDPDAIAIRIMPDSCPV